MGALTEDMKRIVREQRLGFVATVSPEGAPNLSPKGTTAVWDDDHLVFVDLDSPGTVANVRAGSAVEINVVDPIGRKGYRFLGPADVLTEGPLHDAVLAFYENEGSMLTEARRHARAVVLVRVERAAPLVSPGYRWVGSEAEMRAHWRRWYAGVDERDAPSSP